MTRGRELTTFKTGIYWHDYVDTKKDEKLDLKIQVTKPCDEAKIYIKKIQCFDTPEALDRNCDILFFDWGGMSLGNSCMQSFCRQILEYAENFPNRFYVMVSMFTKEAMKEAIVEFGKDKPYNIFLSVEDLGLWLDKHYEED